MTDENPRRLTPDPKSELADLESQWDVRVAVLRVGYQRLWTVIVRGRNGAAGGFERTALSPRLAVLDAIAEAKRRCMIRATA